jgi:SM-20-related protein
VVLKDYLERSSSNTVPFLHITFDKLIDSYNDTQVGIADGFLSHSLSAGLAANINRLRSADALRAAGTGNLPSIGGTFRGDSIHWLDIRHDDQHENAFFDRMDNFVDYLNETCYAGISDYEFHYTLYEAGTRYKNTSTSSERTTAGNFPSSAISTKAG